MRMLLLLCASLLAGCRVCDGPYGYHVPLWMRMARNKPQVVAYCTPDIATCEQMLPGLRQQMPTYEFWCEVRP